MEVGSKLFNGVLDMVAAEAAFRNIIFAKEYQSGSAVTQRAMNLKEISKLNFLVFPNSENTFEDLENGSS